MRCRLKISSTLTCFHSLQRAKQLHPDAATSAGQPSAPTASSHEAFARLLAAYQVLADPRSRQLYNVAREGSGHSSVLRAAASAAVRQGAAYEEVEVRNQCTCEQPSGS